MLANVRDILIVKSMLNYELVIQWSLRCVESILLRNKVNEIAESQLRTINYRLGERECTKIACDHASVRDCTQAYANLVRSVQKYMYLLACAAQRENQKAAEFRIGVSDEKYDPVYLALKHLSYSEETIREMFSESSTPKIRARVDLYTNIWEVRELKN